MEVRGGGEGGRRSREMSPDRGRVSMMMQQQQQQQQQMQQQQQQQMQGRVIINNKPAFKKVQVLYYISRNGQLEHPHYLEIFLSSNQQLRLKDVLDKLTALRGRGMPSLYSWSCKRSYKNGYVWNDLALKDIIYPTEGAEYVLKGSELLDGCIEKFQQVQVSNKQQIAEPNFHSKRKPLTPSRNREPDHEEEENNVDDDNEEEYEYEEKTSYTSSNTSHSRCSRGVSTGEIEEMPKTPIELTLDEDLSSPSTTSSTTISDKANNDKKIADIVSKKFGEEEEGATEIVGTEVVPSRNSVLLQLIACGSKNHMQQNDLKKQSKNSSLFKGVVSKSAAKVNEEEKMMLNCMSLSTRFAKLQSEEKEYFSGSIVESMKMEERSKIEPVLKRSNSYNEERTTKKELGDETAKEVEDEKKDNEVVKGKCLPRKKSTSSSSKQSSSSRK